MLYLINGGSQGNNILMNPKECKEGEKKKKWRSNRKQKYDSYNIYIYRSVWRACYIYIITVNVFGLNSPIQMIIRLDFF